MRKEEGATVAASHLPSLSWLVVRPDGRRLHGNLTLQERPIKYHKCPTNERNAGDFQSSDRLSKTDDQIHVKNAVVKAEAKTVAH